MFACDVCGRPRDDGRRVCSGCREVAALVAEQHALGVELHLVVDGSFDKPPGRALGQGGAGLVLAAWTVTGEVLAHCQCRFACGSSNYAEVAAIRRGRRWAPDVTTWSDNESAIRASAGGSGVIKFIPRELRRPNHALAHRLSQAARVGATTPLDPALGHTDRDAASKAAQLAAELGDGAVAFCDRQRGERPGSGSWRYWSEVVLHLIDPSLQLASVAPAVEERSPDALDVRDRGAQLDAQMLGLERREIETSEDHEATSLVGKGSDGGIVGGGAHLVVPPAEAGDGLPEKPMVVERLGEEAPGVG